MAPEPTPKDRCTALDLRAVVREARQFCGRRLEKAFDLEPRGLGLVFRDRESGRGELWIVPGRYAAVVRGAAEHAEGLSPLAKDVRRLATGAILGEIAEPAGERFLELRFIRSSDPEPTTVGAELFGTGNVVVARGEKVAAVEHTKRWANRELRPGAAYSRPPGRSDAFALSAAAIEAELARSRTDLASTLAARLALGGPLAEEILARAGWDASAPASPRANELAPVVHALLADLLREVGEAPHGFLLRRGEELLDASPFHPRRWQAVPDVVCEELPTFSEAAVRYFAAFLRPRVSPEEARRAEEREGLVRLAERQRAAVGELEADIARLREDADAVYTDYATAAAALESARGSRPIPPTVAVTIAGRHVELSTKGDARAAAQALYEESKRLALKREGAAEALADTERKLAAHDAAPSAPAARPTRAPAARARNPHWFEKFRWFVSSEGTLILGGRDAPSNDLLVRRHLKDGDAYVHADLHGAASVVLKRPAPTAAVSELSVREAAQWAVAFSKAWRAGLASATAFWATPDQVSKSAGAGEFVPRGAWIVRGTKHFVQDVPLELGVGPIRYEGDDLLSVAPPSALRARGEVRFLLLPGDERERADREVELARELGVPRSRLQGLLPAGGLTVRRP